jgi:hypothetical protein
VRSGLAHTSHAAKVRQVSAGLLMMCVCVCVSVCLRPQSWTRITQWPAKLRSRSLLKLALKQPHKAPRGADSTCGTDRRRALEVYLSLALSLSPSVLDEIVIPVSSVLDEIVIPGLVRSSCIRPPPAQKAGIGRRNPLQRRASSLILQSLSRARVGCMLPIFCASMVIGVCVSWRNWRLRILAKGRGRLLIRPR